MLDPRIKLYGVNILLDNYFKNMENEGVDNYKNEISQLLYEVYNYYNNKFG